MLLQEKETFGIGNDNDLSEYRKLIDQKHVELMREDILVEMTQLSFFDVLEG